LPQVDLAIILEQNRTMKNESTLQFLNDCDKALARNDDTKLRMVERWEDVKCGIYLLRIRNPVTKRYGLHLSVKVDERPWFEQPRIPAHSEAISITTEGDFWRWARENLDTYQPAP
jgi:hypothetical protein